MAVLAIPGWIRGWAAYSIYRQMTALPVLEGRPWTFWPALALALVAGLLYMAAALLLRRKEFTR